MVIYLTWFSDLNTYADQITIDPPAVGAPHWVTWLLWALQIRGHSCCGRSNLGDIAFRGAPNWHLTLLLTAWSVINSLKFFKLSSHVSKFGVPPAATSPNLEGPQQPCLPKWTAPSRCGNVNLDWLQQVCHPWSLFRVQMKTLEACSSKLYMLSFFGTAIIIIIICHLYVVCRSNLSLVPL